MRFIENRRLAWLLLVICVIGSVLGLGGAGLARERKALENVFYRGAKEMQTTSERMSMDAYLDRAAECAQIMASEGQLYLGQDNLVAVQMQEALGRFGDDDGIDMRYEAYQMLQRKSDELYNAMYAASLTDAERVNFKRAYDDFWGCDKYVRIDPYRKRASAFNASLESFPASLASKLLGVDGLSSFGA